MNRMAPAKVIHKRRSMKLSPAVLPLPEATCPCSGVHVEVTPCSQPINRLSGLRPSDG